MQTPSEIHADHRQRLKDRFLKNPDSLSKHELVELLLFYAIPRKNVNPEAHRLMEEFGSLDKILRADPDELLAVEGIGPNAAAFIKVVGKIVEEVGKETGESMKFYSFETAKDLLSRFFAPYDYEVFCAFLLAQSGKVLKRVTFTDRDADCVTFTATELTKHIAAVKPHAVVIAHNHPDEVARPSVADDLSTEKMYVLLSLSGVKLYDHVIVGENGFYSYRASGRLDEIIEKAPY